MKLLENQDATLPELAKEELTYLLYVFKGEATINNETELNKKDSLVIKEEAISITTRKDTELVLFVTDEKAVIFKEGIYSGNQA